MKLHGIPSSIVSDRDPKFTSEFWRSLWTSTGTQLLMSTAQHPQTDGQTERTNRTIGSIFRTIMLQHTSKWKELTPMIEFAYNSAFHSSIGMSPFEADIGFLPPTPSTVFTTTTSGLSLTEVQQHLQQIQHEVADNLITTQQTQRFYADQHRRTQTFNVGDQVLISAKQLRAPTSKFDPTWLGPFTVSAVHDNAYTIDLPAEYDVHSTINVSQLKPFIGTQPIPSVTNEQPDAGLSSHSRPQRTRRAPKYLEDFE